MVVGDDHEYFLALVGASDAEVEEFAGVSHGDFSVVADDVVSGAPFFFGVVVGCGFGACGVGLCWCASVQCAVGSLGVVARAELVEERLQLRDGGCWWSGAEPFFKCLVESFDFALGLGMSWAAVFLLDFVGGEDFLECVSASFASGESCGEDESVVGECVCWWAVFADQAG